MTKVKEFENKKLFHLPNSINAKKCWLELQDQKLLNFTFNFIYLKNSDIIV